MTQQTANGLELESLAERLEALPESDQVAILELLGRMLDIAEWRFSCEVVPA